MSQWLSRPPRDVSFFNNHRACSGNGFTVRTSVITTECGASAEYISAVATVSAVSPFFVFKNTAGTGIDTKSPYPIPEHRGLSILFCTQRIQILLIKLVH